MLLRCRQLASLLAIALAAGLFVTACDVMDESVSTRSLRSERSASEATRSASCVGIINGMKTNQYKAVGLIIQKSLASSGLCTGTWVSDNTLITAAHCVANSKTGDVYYTGRQKLSRNMTPEELDTILADAIPSVAAVRGAVELVSGGLKVTESYKDIGIVVFPDGTAPTHMAIRREKPVAGQEVLLVGYGQPTMVGDKPTTDLAEKRFGKNYLVDLSSRFEGFNDILVLQGPSPQAKVIQTGSLPSHGDSGGPMIVGDAIVGVVSAGKAVSTDSTFSEVLSDEGMGLYASLHSEYALSLIERAKKLGARLTYEGDEPKKETKALPQSTCLAD